MPAGFGTLACTCRSHLPPLAVAGTKECTVAGHWSHAQFPLHSYHSYQWLSIPLPFFSRSNELTAIDLVISHLCFNGLLLLRQRPLLTFHGPLTASFFLSIILAIPPSPSLSPSASPHPSTFALHYTRLTSHPSGCLSLNLNQPSEYHSPIIRYRPSGCGGVESTTPPTQLVQHPRSRPHAVPKRGP